MTLTLNGNDAKATYGLVLSDVPGSLDSVPSRYVTSTIVGVPGGLLVGPFDDAVRKLTMNGSVKGTSVADVRAKLDALIAALHAPGGMTLIFADRPTRRYTALLDSFSVAPGEASMLASAFLVTIAVTCLDPFGYDTTNTTVVLSGVAAACALGTGPSRPVVTITATAAATNVTLTLKDSSGATITTMVVTIALANTDVLVIDCAQMIITKNGATAIASLSSGDFPVLDAIKNGNFSASAWPTLTLTLASGTATMSAVYKKAWR